MTLLRTLALLPVAGLLAGCLGMMPEGVEETDVEAYDAAVASIGCQMVGESDYRAVEFQAGLTREQAISITELKLARGQAERLADGGVRLIAGPCAA